jgi:hypothetical protein
MLFLFWLIAALPIGYALRVFVPAMTDWSRSGLALLAAGLASFGFLGSPILLLAREDTWILMLVFCLMFLLPAGFGVHLASLRKPKG